MDIPVIKTDTTFVLWTMYDGVKTFSEKKKKKENMTYHHLITTVTGTMKWKFQIPW